MRPGERVQAFAPDNEPVSLGGNRKGGLDGRQVHKNKNAGTGASVPLGRRRR